MLLVLALLQLLPMMFHAVHVAEHRPQTLNLAPSERGERSVFDRGLNLKMNKPWKSDTLFHFERSDINYNMRPFFCLVYAEMDAKHLTKCTHVIKRWMFTSQIRNL